jgi:nucleotide-binding universal stress UspA family protein
MEVGGMSPNTVVVSYDGSPAATAALHCAAARVRPGGRVVVVHCYDVPASVLHPSEYQERLEDERVRAEAMLAGLPPLEDVELETELLSGPPARLVVNVANERGASEILLGTRGLSAGRALLGSVAHEVIHLAECPVTVIPERALTAVATG